MKLGNAWRRQRGSIIRRRRRPRVAVLIRRCHYADDVIRRNGVHHFLLDVSIRAYLIHLDFRWLIVFFPTLRRRRCDVVVIRSMSFPTTRRRRCHI